MRFRRRHRPVVYLHIGAMKTGTSYLQRLWVNNKQNLAEHGYLFPGENWHQQAAAARDVLHMYGEANVLRPKIGGSWSDMVTTMASHDGPGVIFSHEFLSFANSRKAHRVVRSLTRAGADVHVVLGIRDAIKVLPAQWQTQCRSGGVVSWPEFAAGARSLLDASTNGEQATGARSFARAQDIPRMLEVWGAEVPGEKLHVVTVPPSGSPPSLLWERVAAAMSVDPGSCPIPSQAANESLGQASAELMRLLNVHLGKLPMAQYHPTLKKYLATSVLAPRAKTESKPKLDLATLEFAVRWNAHVRAAVETRGARVVGDLDDLPVDVPPALLAQAPATLGAPVDKEVLEAAVDALNGLHRLADKRARKLSKQQDERTTDPAPVPSVAAWEPATVDRLLASADPVPDAVAELGVVARTAMDLQVRLEAAGG